MNFKYLLLALFLPFIITSCGDIQPPGPVNLSQEKSIIGKWDLQAIEVKIGEKSIKVSEKGLVDNFYKNSSYEFAKEGTFKFVYSDGDKYEGKYSFDKETNALVLIEEGEEEYRYNYTTEFTEAGLEIMTKPIKPIETELFSDDAFYLFEAIALLEDQEIDLENFESNNDDLLVIKYIYKKKV